MTGWKARGRLALGLAFVMLFELFGIGSFVSPRTASAAGNWPDGSGYAMPYAPADGLVTSQNPPDFHWPFIDGADTYHLQVSRSASVASVVYEDAAIVRNYYNFAHTFDAGTWYWRVKYHTSSGGWSDWSAIRRFRIEEDNVPFVVPSVDTLIANVGTSHPRIWTNAATLQDFRDLRLSVGKTVYEARLATATANMNTCAADPSKCSLVEPVFEGIPGSDPFSPAYVQAQRKLRDQSDGAVNVMMDAAFIYLVTGDAQTGAYAKARLMDLASWDPNGSTSYENHDQVHRYIAYNSAMAYDWLYGLLAPAEREQVQDMVTARAERIVSAFASYPIEKNPYDSHGWTLLGYLGIIATALLNDVDEAEDWYRKVVPAYINLLPPWGGEDGGWSQGTGYWRWSSFANKEFADILLSSTGFSLYDKAYSRNEPLYPLYMYPSGSPRGVFGDESHFAPGPPSVAAYKRFAQIYGDARSQWAANAIGTPTRPELPNYFYGDDSVPERLPTDLPNGKWFRDVGYVAMHSSLYDPDRVSLYFRSSPYGTFNHSHANQNGFALNAFGETLAIESGYYTTYGNDHFNHYFKNTFAYNAITFDGKTGQTDGSIEADGRIDGFVTHPDFDATVGEAAAAYGGALDAANRTIIYVRPDQFVVIDRLKAAGAGTHAYEWRLHAEDELSLDADEAGATIVNGRASMKVRIQAPAGVTAEVEDRYLDAAGDEWKPDAPYAQEEQLHAAFVTPQANAATIVATMEAYASDAVPSGVVAENEGTYEKLSYADGTVVYVRLGAAGEVDAGDIRFDGTAMAVKGDTVLLVDGTKAVKNGIAVIESAQRATIVYGGDQLSVSGPSDTAVTLRGASIVRLRDFESGEDIPAGGSVDEGVGLRGVHWTASGGIATVTVEKGQRAFKLNEAPMPGELAPMTLATEIDGAPGSVTLAVYGDTEGVPVGRGSLGNAKGLYEIVEAPDGFTFEKYGVPKYLYLEEDATVIKRGAGGTLKLVKHSGGTPTPADFWSDPEAKRDTLPIAWKEAETFAKADTGIAKYTTRPFLSGGAGVASWDQEGQWIEWKLDVPASGTYDLVFKYVGGWSAPPDGKTTRQAMIGDSFYTFEAPTTYPQDFGREATSWRGLRVKTETTLPAGLTTVRLWHAGGAMNLDWIGLMKPSADEQPPTTPGGVQVVSSTDTGATLSWSASTDDTAVVAYALYADGVQRATVPGTATSGTISGLAVSRTYALTVRAMDASGNRSLASAAASFTTTDTTAPYWADPDGAIRVRTFDGGTARIEWDAAMDNSGKIAAYRLYRKNNPGGAYAETASVAGTTYDVAGLTPGASYSFKVVAEDVSHNVSAAGPKATVTIPATAGSGGDFYETFDAWTTGTAVQSAHPNWTFTTASGTLVEVAELPEGGKALQSTDNYNDPANPYAETPYTKRSVSSPLGGQVVAETRFRFKEQSTPIGTFYFSLLGDANGEVARFNAFSDGAFGYMKQTNGTNGYVRIPLLEGGSSVPLPHDAWITVRAELDTDTKTYNLSVQSDGFKSLAGKLATGKFDAATGTFRVEGLPFLNAAANVSSVTGIAMRSGLYTGILQYDYLTMYEDTSFGLVPTDLQVGAQTSVSTTIEWTAPQDADDVLAYRVYLDGVQQAEVPGGTLSAVLTGLTVGETYAVTVRSVDTNGRRSKESAPIQITIPDTVAPEWATGAAIQSDHAFADTVKLSWDAASDNSGTVAAYRVYRKDNPGGSFVQTASVSGIAYDATGLSPGGTYTFKLKAEDASGNVSADGPELTVTLPLANTGDEFYESFDGWTTGTVTTGGGWTVSATGGTGVQAVALSGGGKALQIEDSYHDAANEYAETPFVRRSTSAIGGKVAVETRFRFEELSHPFGAFTLRLMGGSTEVARFSGLSEGLFGYTKRVNGVDSYGIIPKSYGFALPHDEWLTLRYELDMDAKTYAIEMQSDSLKAYAGTVDAPGTLDRATGVYRIEGLSMLSTAAGSVSEIRFVSSRYTSRLKFDYVTMYQMPSGA